ncbi:hypothetical protein G9A89_005170 [Geosiphon pyriformis]|nr:hypothetical protein G9A89_005170 [Geosiphon pyriformis]
MLSDFLGVCHQPIDQILTLKLMLRMNNGLTPNSQEVHSDSMALYNQMGLIYLNLGYTGKAGLAFSKAKMIMDSCNVVNETKLKWILGYSQYLCCIGNFPKSSQYFDQAQILANSKPPEPKVISHPNNLKRRKGEQMLLADASFTRSVIASRLGLLEAAILDSTRTLRLLNRIISNINSNISMQLINTIDENPFLVEDSTHLSVSKSKDSCKILSFTDQCFLWPVLKRLLTCFQHLGQLYVIRGSPKEADFFLRRGLELTQGINGYSAISHSLLSLAVLDSQKHSWQDSEDNFEKALKFQQEGEVVKKDEAVAKLFFGDLKFRKRDYETALQLYRLAENILSDIMKQEYISHMELINLNVFQTPRSKKLISISPLTPKSKSSTDGNIQFECFLLTHIKADLFRREGLVLTKQKKFDDGFQIIQNCKVINQSRLEKIEHLLALGKNRIQYIISKLSQPPFSTFEIFSESVLSLPPIKQTSKGRVKVRSDEIIHLDCEIEQATGYLKEAFDLAFESGTTHSLHDIAFALAKIYMIKAYNQKSTSVQRSDLVIACVFYLEMTKGIAAKREMIAAISERLVPAYKFDDKKWPSGFSTIVNNQNLNEEIFDEENQMNNLNFFSSLGKLYKKEINMTYDQFKSQFIDILPPHWTICTISIDTEFEEMYICRLHQKNQPLILRLPLIRQPNQEGQENFSYETMIAELNDIINASNVTMRAGKAYETIKEKTEWWNKRKELDERLQQLLANIENCWLGGFKVNEIERNLSVDDSTTKSMMYKFKSKIETIISKVVQNLICKKSKDQTSKKSPSFDIDIDVELCKVFFDLGQEASAEDIEDFLYFLLDTYHYNGVPIAYDEVNMNQLIADVQDIINSFSAFKPIDTEKQKGATEHIILILDKSVQMIPWESLPCLRTRPISRLPSLTFLRDRILLAQEKNVQKPGVWAEHTIDRRKVFYVLNPSQDLKNTEKEFKNFLQSYETWDGVIGRAPILQECKNGLANNDLYIYFGHGSGDQYIRGPQVRQLDRCAVTLLMGCSSGYLKPAGEFDPTGTALSYIMSGCPALVGTLWDVTDKDIDRYSKALFQEWGLDPKISPSNKTTSNVNISQRQNLQPEHQISLVEAVSMVRDNCVLKYLNGAAPVVYGIPCYLVTDH